ncbi:MAG: DUF58 domain-containing protein [Bacteroidales bacterium]|jgi:uncharacterized protein (DUF58 family)|nr:DUF58 domain-containing protein [Bacteroidales bacterium]
MQLSDIEQYSQFDNFEFIAQQIVEGFITGLHRSPFHGFSVEFAEHRLYNNGESIKHIDWKLFAKTDKLFVKKFEEETNLRCQILIDTSSSMLFPFNAKGLQNKLAFSLYAAAALIYLLRKQRDAIGLSLFDYDLYFHTQARLHPTHIQTLYNQLRSCLLQAQSTTSFNKKTSLARNLNHIAEIIHKRSLVILFSDFFQEGSYSDIFSALQHLKYNKHEVIVFHVSEPQHEELFAFNNRPLKITDMETGETIKILPNTIRERYSQKVQSMMHELQEVCTCYHIDYIKADITKGFEQVLLNYLIKRNKLG